MSTRTVITDFRALPNRLWCYELLPNVVEFVRHQQQVKVCHATGAWVPVSHGHADTLAAELVYCKFKAQVEMVDLEVPFVGLKLG